MENLLNKCGNYRLDIACGTVKENGYLGVDKSTESNADIIHDLTKGMPFCNNSAIEVRAYNFFEHLTNDQFIDLMWEIWRVLKPGGKVKFLVPHGLSETQIKDPTHRHNGFCEKTFTYFEAGHLRQKQYNLPPFTNIKAIRNGNSIEGEMEAVKK